MNGKVIVVSLVVALGVGGYWAYQEGLFEGIFSDRDDPRIGPPDLTMEKFGPSEKVAAADISPEDLPGSGTAHFKTSLLRWQNSFGDILASLGSGEACGARLRGAEMALDKMETRIRQDLEGMLAYTPGGAKQHLGLDVGEVQQVAAQWQQDLTSLVMRHKNDLMRFQQNCPSQARRFMGTLKRTIGSMQRLHQDTMQRVLSQASAPKKRYKYKLPKSPAVHARALFKRVAKGYKRYVGILAGRGTCEARSKKAMKVIGAAMQRMVDDLNALDLYRERIPHHRQPAEMAKAKKAMEQSQKRWNPRTPKAEKTIARYKKQCPRQGEELEAFIKQSVKTMESMLTK